MWYSGRRSHVRGGAVLQDSVEKNFIKIVVLRSERETLRHEVLGRVFKVKVQNCLIEVAIRTQLTQPQLS